MSKLNKVMLITLMLFLGAGLAGTFHAHQRMLEPQWNQAMMVGAFVGFWFASIGGIMTYMMVSESPS